MFNPSPKPLTLSLNGCDTDNASADVDGTEMETWFEEGTSWKARCGALEAGFEDVTPLVEEEGTAPESEPPKVGCMRFLGLRFAMSVLICSPPFRTVAGVTLPKSWPCVRGDGGGVIR